MSKIAIRIVIGATALAIYLFLLIEWRFAAVGALTLGVWLLVGIVLHELDRRE